MFRVSFEKTSICLFFSSSCILHLNQHHDTLKNDFHQTIHDAGNHRSLLEEQIERLKQQHNALNKIYEREITNLNQMHQLVKNICGNNYLLISDYDRYAKQWQSIKQNQMNNSFLQPFMFQIDQLLQQQDSLNGMKSFQKIFPEELIDI